MSNLVLQDLAGQDQKVLEETVDVLERLLGDKFYKGQRLTYRLSPGSRKVGEIQVGGIRVALLAKSRVKRLLRIVSP